jgi:maleamate amidohydrolase
VSAAQDDYAAAGLQGALRIDGEPALVVVDPATAYTDPGCPLYAGVEEPVAVMRRVLAQARAAGVPVVITRVEHDPSGRTGGIFVRKVPAVKWFAPDSPYSGYIDGLAPAEGDIEIVKQYPSAFAHTSLAATLTSLGVDTLLIAGLTTSGCVRATATDAMQNGFVPVVVADAVGDRLPGPHEANLFDIRAKIGEVVPSADVARLLRGRA